MKPELRLFSILTVTTNDDNLYKKTFSVAEVALEMEIDTGAATSVMSEKTYKEKFLCLPLQRSNVKLKAYNRGYIPVIGQIISKAVYEDQKPRFH